MLAAQQAVLVALRAHELRARTVPTTVDGAPSIYDSCLRGARNALALARAGAARARSAGLVARARAVRLHAAAASSGHGDDEAARLLLRVRHFLEHRAPPVAVAVAMAALSAEMHVAAARAATPATGRRTRARRPVVDVTPVGRSIQVCAPAAACPICLSAYDADNLARRCASCRHLFHASCIDA